MQQQESVLDVKNLTKRYQSGHQLLTVLNGVSFTVPQGSACSVMGPSGSGKTTLLGLCAGLDQPNEGSVTMSGTPLASLNEEERARHRRESIGFVFQSFRLVSTLTALENVMIPLELSGQVHVRERAAALLERVGLKDRMSHFPSQLSGGEQQRVGIARAFVHKPKILFADEPTGNLDAKTGNHIAELLFDLNQTEKIALVVVTHNQDLARQTGRILRLNAGSLVADESY